MSAAAAKTLLGEARVALADEIGAVARKTQPSVLVHLQNARQAIDEAQVAVDKYIAAAEEAG